jgi:hypothetical protein
LCPHVQAGLGQPRCHGLQLGLRPSFGLFLGLLELRFGAQLDRVHQVQRTLHAPGQVSGSTNGRQRSFREISSADDRHIGMT